ncbi:MAG TPA: acetate--CoA ligase [Nitrososphaerales archaeon]|nr:acetate--CoA ligase [Nitrososphaerales archaeon]
MSELGEVLPTDSVVNPGIEKLRQIHQLSINDPESYWRDVSKELFWSEKSGPAFEKMEAPPFGKWFGNWKTNICYNALDKHVNSPRRNKIAYYWEGEDGTERTISYAQLLSEVSKFTRMLRDFGVRKGDRVTIYLPMIPELPVAMLATLRMGAIHSVVFAGFTAQAVADRIDDSKSKIVITADGAYRRGKVINLKVVVDEALSRTSSVEKVVVVKRTGTPVHMMKDRDHWYHDLMADRSDEPIGVVSEAEMVEGTHPSYILYTSGTTGKPKGATHSTGGYMVWTFFTQKAVFDVKDEDVYWCAADIGWVTGHSYIVYGPLLTGATSIIYEGAPDFPAPDRWWKIINKYKVTIFYTSPTAIRSHMKFGEHWVKKYDLSSLRLLGSVGEPINPEAWNWYYFNIGLGRTPIVDTWWQTETGGIMISPQPGIAVIPLKRGSATFPLPGVEADVLTEDGERTKAMEKGYLVIKKPWPGQFVTLWNDPERFSSVYFSRYPGFYYPGDYAVKDRDGYFWLLGRADEVLKVAGHRIGTIELEDALISHGAVAESAVIGKADPIKMQVPVAFVVLRPGREPSHRLRTELLNHIRKTIGPIAVPEAIYFVDKLPKTRSGKIMRRVVGAVAQEKPIGDVTTLEDETSVEEAKRAYEELKTEMQSSLEKTE